MSFVAGGGYVATTDTRNFVRSVKINDKKLLEIAKILGIPKAIREKLVSEVRSIYIYRGK
jgi:hypothetical protein